MTVGSVERPVEILTGKRERRKVDRLSANMFTPATPAEKKRTLIPEGSGVKLGDCPASKILVMLVMSLTFLCTMGQVIHT